MTLLPIETPSNMLLDLVGMSPRVSFTGPHKPYIDTPVRPKSEVMRLAHCQCLIDTCMLFSIHKDKLADHGLK